MGAGAPTGSSHLDLTDNLGETPFDSVAAVAILERLTWGIASVPGLYFADFTVGQAFKHEVRRTVTDMDNMLFSSLTYNPAAIHIDHHYAASTEFGRPLMNSIFTLGLVIGLSVQDTTFGTTVANLGMTETTFPKPVFAGDTLRAETRVMALRPSRSRPGQGVVTFEHLGLNQRDETVCRTLRAALMLGRP